MNTTDKSDYLVISRGQWDTDVSKAEIQTAIDEFYRWLTKSIEEGRMKMGSRLDNDGATVSKTGIDTDGPYGEGKEVIGGYWWIVAGSLAEAAEIADASPCLKYGIIYELRTLDPELASAYSQAVEIPNLKVSQ
jgi:hypothetical protein